MHSSQYSNHHLSMLVILRFNTRAGKFLQNSTTTYKTEISDSNFCTTTTYLDFKYYTQDIRYKTFIPPWFIFTSSPVPY